VSTATPAHATWVASTPGGSARRSSRARQKTRGYVERLGGSAEYIEKMDNQSRRMWLKDANKPPEVEYLPIGFASRIS
jgi:hypothetical protein